VKVGEIDQETLSYSQAVPAEVGSIAGFSDRPLLESGVVGRPVVAMVEMDGAVGVGVGGGVEAARRWRLADERCDLRAMESEYVRRFHRHEPCDHQCSSAVAKHIKAPVHLVSSRLSHPPRPPR
jgi:hypothetical protein